MYNTNLNDLLYVKCVDKQSSYLDISNLIHQVPLLILTEKKSDMNRTRHVVINNSNDLNTILNLLKITQF